MATNPVPCLNPTARIALTLVSAVPGGPAGLSADIVPSEQADNGIVNEVDGLFAPARPPLVSSIPSNPYNGQEIYLLASSSGSTCVWHMRYNSTSANSDKWDFVGGPSLTNEDDSVCTLNGQGDGNYHIPGSGTTVGVTPGFLGIYEIFYGAQVNPTTPGSYPGSMAKTGIGPEIDGVMPGDSDSASAFIPWSTYIFRSVQRAVTQNSGGTVRIVYSNANTINTNPCTFDQKVIGVRPVRLA